MTLPIVVAAAEAAVFTLGCAFIHSQKRLRAERLTVLLAAVAYAAFLALVVMSTPEDTTMAEVAAEMGSPLPLPGEPRLIEP
ncbi:hypothetical protein [Methylobacterium nodulans]|uniref:Uncharacterized protein n=1 Tax=Methylobacterium nodulans (strain LMG 21967 / CNCM I-2342 / ORS 2060) TaxID=460265 RepID=B8IY66_METNO|nr:hypothetical protein [Methylobacterium nodulans]ACL63356.1 conserved hypothetical protein [Methylobacterium nodulans ORS 2060]